jgi:hypothetical protein
MVRSSLSLRAHPLACSVIAVVLLAGCGSGSGVDESVSPASPSDSESPAATTQPTTSVAPTETPAPQPTSDPDALVIGQLRVLPGVPSVIGSGTVLIEQGADVNALTVTLEGVEIEEIRSDRVPARPSRRA